MMAHAFAFLLGKYSADGVAARVVLSEALGHCPLHDGRDALAHTSRGFRFLVPDRHEHAKDICRVDIRHRALAQARVDVGAQSCLPLRGVLGVTPTRPVKFNDGRHGCLEGRYAGLPPKVHRISTGACGLAVGKRFLAGLCQRY